MSIIMERIFKSYGKTEALKGVSLNVSEGEIYGFIGPNGAGKTTTIRILLGMLRADRGKTTIFGQDPWKDAVEIHKRVAYVPGEVSLWPNLTGGEVIDFFGRLRNHFDVSMKNDLIKRFELDPTKKCRTYSKGNRQKVSLITALAADVDLYILDEPTSGLDPLMEQVFQECVLELKRAGKTILLSSHILSEVEKLCDRISIIREGEIIKTGTLDELRYLARTNVRLKTRKKIPGLDEMKGVHNVLSNHGEYHFQIDFDYFPDVIRFVSAYDVTKLDTTPPKLEDLFIEHYTNKGDSR